MRYFKYTSIFSILVLLMVSCAPSSQLPTTTITPPTLIIQPTQLTGTVPFAPPAPPMRKTITHEVAPLESLWRISKMYDVSQQDIVQANNLVNNQLKTGQKLTIPNAAPMQTFIPLYPNSMWKYIVIHHTASDIGSARLVENWHRNRGFWNGLGYHFLIDNGTVGKQDGQIETAPRWIKQQVGAHCKADGMNEKGIGISLVGNFNNEQPSQQQMESLVFLVKQLMDYYKIPETNVIRHRDACGAQTECPGNQFPWQELKQRIQS